MGLRLLVFRHTCKLCRRSWDERQGVSTTGEAVLKNWATYGGHNRVCPGCHTGQPWGAFEHVYVGPYVPDPLKP